MTQGAASRSSSLFYEPPISVQALSPGLVDLRIWLLCGVPLPANGGYMAVIAEMESN